MNPQPYRDSQTEPHYASGEGAHMVRSVVMVPIANACVAYGDVFRTVPGTQSQASDVVHALFHHLKNFVVNLAEIAKAASWLAVIFATVALVIVIILICVTSSDSRTKLLGTLFVTALCFAANHLSAYLLGIFIIATLVTELQFLEKLAAIFWNRKEYWEYLTKSASPHEIERKHQQEVREQEVENSLVVERAAPPAPSEGAINLHLQFERAALDALQSPNGPLQITKLNRNIQISGPNVRLVVDAIAEAPGAAYVIEVKFARSLREPRRVAGQLSRYADAYLVFLRQQTRGDEVRKLLIVPPGAVDPQAFNDIAVLEYDVVVSGFTNVADAKDRFSHWHWRQ